MLVLLYLMKKLLREVLVAVDLILFYFLLVFLVANAVVIVLHAQLAKGKYISCHLTQATVGAKIALLIIIS